MNFIAPSDPSRSVFSITFLNFNVNYYHSINKNIEIFAIFITNSEGCSQNIAESCKQRNKNLPVCASKVHFRK